MDFLGWFGLGILVVLFIGAWRWGAAADRKRAAGARAWAKSIGLVELRPDQEGVPSDLAVRRYRNIPSFVGTLAGRQVSVIATSTKPRLGDLWALCTRSNGPPVFLGNRLGFSAASAFGKAAPRGWVRVEAGPDVDAVFLVSVPPGEHPAAQLSADAREALVKASVHAWCFSAAPGGFTVLWFKQTLGQDTQQALAQAAQLLSRLLT